MRSKDNETPADHEAICFWLGLGLEGGPVMGLVRPINSEDEWKMMIN